MDTFSPDYILFALTIGGIAFAIYRSYRDPQANSDRTDAVLEVKIGSLQTSVARILENHLPHLDAKVEDIHGDISQLKISVAQLTTIIDERIPRK